YFELFKNQLIFMPAYLFFMYVALTFISSDGFNKIFNQNVANVSQAAEKGIGPVFLGVVVQYAIALVFINIPLLAAIKLGAVGADWVPKANTFTGWLGRKTVG